MFTVPKGILIEWKGHILLKTVFVFDFLIFLFAGDSYVGFGAANVGFEATGVGFEVIFANNGVQRSEMWGS